jgi:hypothetical protein
MPQPVWKLKAGVNMDAATAEEVAKIACALKSLSVYTSMVCEGEDTENAELKKIVDDGLDAMTRVFEW